ncbi:MAG: hypothetical protein ACWA42_11165, partial [Lutibacter sp.]
MKKFIIILLLFSSTIFYAQVKIGDNPSIINSNSLLELESSNKVFVLNKMNTVQMNSLSPLKGALVYNTDDECIFIFDGNSWKSLCNSGTDDQQISFDSANNLITLENGGTVDLSKFVETNTTLVYNNDGTYTYTNESGNTTVINVNDADSDATNEL